MSGTSKSSHTGLAKKNQLEEQIVNAVPDLLFRVDKDGVILDYRTPNESLLYLPPEKFLEKNLDEILPLNVSRPSKSAIEHALTSRLMQSVEYQLPLNGQLRWYENRVVPLSDNDALCIIRDITDRKQAEENTARLASIVRSTDDAIIGKNLNGIITSWNKGAETMYGYTEVEAIGKSISIIIPPSATDEMSNILDEIRQGKHIEHYETKRRKKDGTIIDVSLTISPIYDAEGKIIAASTIGHDVTKRKLTEHELSTAKELLERMFSSIHVLVAYLDRDFNFIKVNAAYAKADGHLPEFFPGKNHFDLYPNEENKALFNRTIETGIPYTVSAKPFSYPQYPERGISYWDWRVEPVRDMNGAVQGLILSLLDVTEQKKAEETLKERERHSQSLLRLSRALEQAQTYGDVLNAAQDEVRSIIGYQNLWTYLFSPDKKTCTAFFAKGRMSEVVMGEENIATLTIEGDRMLEEIAEARGIVVVEDALTDPRTNKKIVTQLGNRTIVNIPIILFDKHLGSVGTGTFGKEGIRVPTESEKEYLTAIASHMAVTMDRIHLLDERKKKEEELRSASLYARSLIEASLDPLVTINFDGKITDVNRATELVTGIDRAKLIGTDFSDYFTEPEKARAGYLQVLKDGLIKDFPLTIRHISGTTTEVLYHASVYKNERGDILGVFAAARDITEHKRAEEAQHTNEKRRHQLELELTQAQKLESLGTLASGIAHDFNNILAIIMTHSSLGERLISSPEKILKNLQAINKASKRGALLIKQLLTFARKAEVVFQSVHLNDLLVEIIKLLEETFPKTIIISTHLQQKMPSVVADVTQMHQVIMNLCINSRDAMPKGGSLSISTSTVGNAALSQKFPHATEREYVLLEIADTGMGIDPEIQQRIFDPFFTTKGPGKGTGLGLALVHSIIKSLNGMIEVTSTPGKGTAFHIYIPIQESRIIADQPTEEHHIDLPAGTETILFIEDEDLLIETVSALLETKGYTVLIAHDGVEAVSMFKQHQHDISIVLTDFGLPKFSGDEVIRKITAIKPNTKIILASGFIDPAVKSEMINLGVTNFIQKPYSLAEIERTVRNLIDQQT